MGAIYTRNYDGTILRDIDKEYREQLLVRFYDKHHAAFEEVVESKLNSFGRCLIIDGHSFYPSALPYENDKSERADFCIGTDSFHTPQKIVPASINFFEQAGYSVKMNSPFAGSIVPLKFYGKDKRVASIMLEINRKLYIDENARKNENFGKIKKLVSDFVNMLEREI